MSKIEIYQRRKEIASRVKSHYLQASGLKIVDKKEVINSNNDKHTIRCSFEELGKGDWNNIILRLHLSHGYYGSSSGYSDTCKDTGEYVARAITCMGKSILETAAQLAELDAEKARLDAETEAKEVLNKIQEGL